MVDLSSLNANQLEAVSWTDGPLLVLAGPGSGKTRVLTYRIARIVEDSQGKPFRILGLTFTNRAASEMNTRIQGLVPNARNRDPANDVPLLLRRPPPPTRAPHWPASRFHYSAAGCGPGSRT